MSKTLVQPVGQKRFVCNIYRFLRGERGKEVRDRGHENGKERRKKMSGGSYTNIDHQKVSESKNVAVVRLKKQGNHFEIVCYKNKDLSWRSGMERDIDEVLQSRTVYSNVRKGVLAKSKDLIKAFGSDDHTKICLKFVDKGELQIAGKERESQFSSHLWDITTIVMQKTIKPEIQWPYTISMVKRLMHEVHFAVDPHSSSKKQAIDVIHELQKHFPIKHFLIRLRLTVHVQNFTSLLEKLKEWDASVFSKDESGTQMSTVCEMESGLFQECDFLVRNMQGRLEILAVLVHAEGDTSMDHYDEHDDMALQTNKPLLLVETETDPFVELSIKMQNQEGEGKGIKCSTCNMFVGEDKLSEEPWRKKLQLAVGDDRRSKPNFTRRMRWDYNMIKRMFVFNNMKVFELRWRMFGNSIKEKNLGGEFILVHVNLFFHATPEIPAISQNSAT